eukprot:jgi/Bigna1/74102/fgenesh1_pg.27_\
MANVASSSDGAKAISATSSDSRFPVSNVIDGDSKTCWVTTGLYPQEFIIAFPESVSIARIRTQTRNVRNITVEYCDQRQPTSFETLYGPVEIKDEGTGLQIESQQCKQTSCRFLKVKILSGWSDFAVVYSFEAEGGM